VWWERLIVGLPVGGGEPSGHGGCEGDDSQAVAGAD
jgi:hypothetical protein